MAIFFYDGLDYDPRLPIIANFFIGRLLGAPDVSAIFSLVGFYCVIKENRLEKATKWVRQTAFFLPHLHNNRRNFNEFPFWRKRLS